MTAKKIILAIIFIPIAVILIAFIVANRTMVGLTLNPFHPGSEDFTYNAPFAVWLFVFLAFGILIGGLTTWFTQHKYRKALKDAQTELQGLKMSATKQHDISIH